MFIAIAAAALATAPTTTTTAPKAPPPIAAVDTPKSGKKPATVVKKDPMAEFGKIMLMFDKFFPAQPEPDPARLELARTSMNRLIPNGSYGKAFGNMAELMADRVLSMSESDIAFGTAKKPSTDATTMRDMMVKDDPNFLEREKIIRRVGREELVKIFAILEPSLREGLAKSLARRLDAKQLTDLNAFLATDSGRAFGEQSVGMWFDPDIARSMFQTMPAMLMAVPGAIARIDKETAHLPKPPKKKAPASTKKEEGADDHDHPETGDAGE